MKHFTDDSRSEGTKQKEKSAQGGRGVTMPQADRAMIDHSKIVASRRDHRTLARIDEGRWTAIRRRARTDPGLALMRVLG